MSKTWLTFYTKFKVVRLWESFICFGSEDHIHFRLTTIKSVAFLFLLQRCISGAGRRVGISKVSYMTSITFSTGGPLSASLVIRVLSWLRWFLCVNCRTFITYIMFLTLFSIVSFSPKYLLSLKILKKTLSPGLYCFILCKFFKASSVSEVVCRKPTCEHHFDWCFINWCNPVYLKKLLERSFS